MRNSSGKTAISRVNPSRAARYFADQLSSGQTLLDWGCGDGKDISFYRSLGLDADGYDQDDSKGFTIPHDRQVSGFLYDNVTCSFVLNVIRTRSDRISCLEDAASWLRTGGAMFVAARSRKEIDRLAAKGNKAGKWPRQGDGYISSRSRDTFQHGLTVGELEELIGDAGLACDAAWGDAIPNAVVAFARKYR